MREGGEIPVISALIAAAEVNEDDEAAEGALDDATASDRGEAFEGELLEASAFTLDSEAFWVLSAAASRRAAVRERRRTAFLSSSSIVICFTF